jgi:Pyridoxamine 5'-phosphate oxidase
MIEARQLQELTQTEALRLLSSVPVGRVVFTHHALPAIRPMNHLVIDNKIIIITSLGSAISSQAGSDGGTVVAYEADSMDPDTHLGWSVVVIGQADHVASETEAADYRRALQSWVAGEMDVIVIRAELVTGYRLVAGDEPQAAIG